MNPGCEQVQFLIRLGHLDSVELGVNEGPGSPAGKPVWIFGEAVLSTNEKTMKKVRFEKGEGPTAGLENGVSCRAQRMHGLDDPGRKMTV